MTVLRVGHTAMLVALLLAIAGCGAVGSVASRATTTSPTTAAAPATIIVTRTIVVTETVPAATSAPGAAEAPTTSATGPTTSTTRISTASSTTTDVAIITATSPHATPTAAPGSMSVASASDVVLEFLGALESNPSGKTSLQYLSSRLQEQVRSGRPMASIMGIQNMYTRYHADAAISRGGGRAATVRATLTDASGSVQRLFTLIPEGGAWHIDDVAESSA